ncbi:hypothetical protein [Embleya sp. NPDC005971]|uniref:hypothetical protein n=1 Tax=Embleya sp. NPDC005971 TaxID=3156724 RepID=UPI0033F2D7D8
MPATQQRTARLPAYDGPLAWTDRALTIDGTIAYTTVRVPDAGSLGVTRRQMVESLAHGYDVRTSRISPDVGAPYDRHAVWVQGDTAAVVRFVAALPTLLATIERAATVATRALGTWMRDSACGQRWTEYNDASHQRVARRHWRREYMRALATRIGPERAPDRDAPPMPDRAENHLALANRIAHAQAATVVDVDATRDHAAETAVLAAALLLPPREPQPERYIPDAHAVQDAIWGPPLGGRRHWWGTEPLPEIGDVVTTYGPRDDEIEPEPQAAPAPEVEAEVEAEVEVEAEAEPETAPEVEATRDEQPHRADATHDTGTPRRRPAGHALATDPTRRRRPGPAPTRTTRPSPRRPSTRARTHAPRRIPANPHAHHDGPRRRSAGRARHRADTR